MKNVEYYCPNRMQVASAAGPTIEEMKQEQEKRMLFPIGGTPLDGSTGYGFEYAEWMVADLLTYPVSNTPLILPEGEESYWPETFNRDRIRVGEPSGKWHTGPWFYQGGEPTCYPWAIANALTVIQATPHTRFMTTLLNSAAGIAIRGKRGLKPADVVNILPKEGERDFAIEQRGITRGLKNPSTPNEWNTHVATNSLKIKRSLDDGESMVVIVNNFKYAKRVADTNHAVCVSGYQIDLNGAMNVQIIDPSRGLLWMPIEHLTESVIDGTTHVYYKP